MRCHRALLGHAVYIVMVALLWLQPTYAGFTLSVTPRFSSEEMLDRLGPLAKMLGERLHSQVDIVLAADFQDYEQRLKNGRFDIAFSNPTHYSRATAANEVVAMEAKATESRLRGLIVVRADSTIKSVRDLIGHPVAIVAWQSTAGFLSQKVFLESQGIQPKTQLKLQEVYGNKQENVLLSVYQGDVDAGFINEDALHVVDRYVPPGQIRILARTTWLPNWAVSVKRTLPNMVKARIRQAILELQPGDPILKTLKVVKFVPAIDADYDVVRRALDLPVQSFPSAAKAVVPAKSMVVMQPAPPTITASQAVIIEPIHRRNKRLNGHN